MRLQVGRTLARLPSLWRRDRKLPPAQRRTHKLSLEPLEDRTLLSWTTVASLPAVSSSAAAATLPDGRILATGLGATTTTGVAIYDPATNVWTSVASLPSRRANFGLATGGDGRVYAIGGAAFRQSGITFLNTVEAYDPRTNTWTAVASMPTARSSLGAATGTDGRIYAIGGFNSPNFIGGEQAVAEVYTPSTNTWTAVASMPTARSGLAAATGPDGRIYAIGGFGRTASTPQVLSGEDLSVVEAYNTTTNTWTAVASMPTPRIGLGAATGPDGRIYAVGGDSQSQGTRVDAYSVATNSWQQVDPLPTGRSNLGVTTGGDGRIYAAGGALLSSQGGNTAEVDAFTVSDITALAGSPGQRFVSQLYLDLLGRNADAQGQAFFSAQLAAGQSRLQIIGQIENSLEFRTMIIQNLYGDLLNRAADAQGLAFSLQAFNDGATAEQLEAFILGSDEFFAVSGGTNLGFLQNLYSEVLERSLDSQGQQFWGNLLTAGASRLFVASQVLNSTESEQRVVNNLYVDLLRRAAEQNALNVFVPQLQNGLSEEELSAFILTSPEYYTLVNAAVHQRYVSSLYLFLLGRQGSASEVAGWVNQLNQAVLKPAQVAAAFEASSEGRAELVNQLYFTYLGRAADPDSLALGVNALGAGTPVGVLAAGILGSQEYFTRSGGTNSGFAAALYLDTLGRQIDTATRSLITQTLTSGVSRTQIAQIVLSSPEGLASTVNLLYSQFLFRQADAAGSAAWVAFLQAGGGVQQMIASLVSSQEFFANL